MTRWLPGVLAAGLFLWCLSRLIIPFASISGQYPQCKDPDPKLLNVLLIGDSTQIRYFPFVKAELKGKANVFGLVEWAPQRVHSLFYGGPLLQPVNARSTVIAKEQLTEWLGDIEWDVVHFNWGIHDLGQLRWRDPNSAEVDQFMQQYRGNLDRLTKRIKATGAKPIMALTTPIPPGLGYPEDIVTLLNNVAMEVTNENSIEINDLYSITYSRVAELQDTIDVHFNHRGNMVLASSTARSILKSLDM